MHREVLPNGLTLLAKRDPSAPVVAVVTHVRAGFFDEPDRWAGISHVLEHMYFKGTARRGPGAIARETKAAGGYVNASTSYDRTVYFAVLPAAGLAAALDIQADALRHSAIDADELRRELGVIIQEAKRKLDTPSAVTQETLFELMFDRHRIRRWRIGTEAALAGFTQDDVLGYYRSRYVPGRTIVSIVGDVPVDESLRLARAAYGDWAPGDGAVDPSPEEPWVREVRARTLRGDVTDAELALGWRGPPALHADEPPLDLATAILSTGRGSRLYRRLREPGVALSASAWGFTPGDLGLIGLGADAAPDKIDAVLTGLGEEVAALVDAGPSADEVERARTLLDVRLARRMESMETQATAYAGAEALGGLDVLDREYAALHAVTPDDVREAAGRYLHADAIRGVVFLPNGRGEELTADRLRERFGGAARRTLDRPLLPALVPPAAAAADGTTAGGVLHVALAGVDLLVARKVGAPLVTLGLSIPRGVPEALDEAGIGVLAARSAVRGAGGYDAATLAGLFERIGGSLGPAVGTDTIGYGTTVLAERAADAAALLALTFTEPRFDEATVTAERDVLVAEAERASDDMFRFPFQLAFGAAFGDVAYGVPVGGRPESLRTLDAGAVRRWHEALRDRARPVVVAVGDLDPAELAGTLAGVFGPWPARERGVAQAPLGFAFNGQPLERVLARDKAQTAFAMLFAGPERGSAERHVADVWSAVASGLGGRLFEALRDKRSLAYTVMASAWQRQRAGALLGYIATSPEREDEARTAMLAELARFRDELVSETEYRQAVDYLAGQAQVARQSMTAVASEILDVWLAGEPLETLADPAAGIRAVTREQIRDLARRWLDPARRAEGVIRGTGVGALTR